MTFLGLPIKFIHSVSEGYLLRDARTFTNWGIDMHKMDGCHSEVLDMSDAYPALSYFLNSTGRPILYSCSWPAYNNSMDYSQLPPYCNMWRNWNDIACNWVSLCRVIDKFGNMTTWAQWAGPGHWNDPDQLVIGMRINSWVKGITIEESRTQFALWAILAAPLSMSADLRVVPDWARVILQNTDIIAVNQDALGKQGTRITPWGNDATVWVRELKDGDYAVALFNRGDLPRDSCREIDNITDLYTHQNLGVFTDSFVAVNLTAHDTVMLRLQPVK
jgi:hypothetical protein